MKFYSHTIPSPIGHLRLYANEKNLVALFMEQEKRGPRHKLLASAEVLRTDVLAEAEEQLRLYFSHQLKTFSVPVEFYGTDFQKKVWQGLQNIAHGEVRSYGEHAKSLNNLEAVRAVSAAIGSNPLSIIVPCHRVVAKNGNLTGYAGGLEVKKWLLQHEGHQMT